MTKEIPELSIILPIYNEEKSLPELLARIHKTVCEQQKIVCELICINDGSSDSSRQVLQSLAQHYRYMRLFLHDTRQGKCAAISAGFAMVRGDIVIVMDSDLQHSPEDIPLFVERIREGYDLVNAVRLKRQANCVYKIYSRLLSFLIAWICRIKVEDPSSNFIAVREKYIRNLSLYSNDHRYLIPILMKRGAARFTEVCVTHQKRVYGISKYGLHKGIIAFFEWWAFCRRFWCGRYMYINESTTIFTSQSELCRR